MDALRKEEIGHHMDYVVDHLEEAKDALNEMMKQAYLTGKLPKGFKEVKDTVDYLNGILKKFEKEVRASSKSRRSSRRSSMKGGKNKSRRNLNGQRKSRK